LRRDISEVLQPTGRAILEREALPLYLQNRRWFGSKGEKLTAVKLAYAVTLGEGISASLITEVEATIGDRVECYTLPLGICRDDQTSGPLAQALALTRVRRTADVGYLTDAFALDSFARNVIDAWRADRVMPFAGGRLEFRKPAMIDEMVLSDDLDVRRLSAEQSNSSMIVNEQIVIKIIRKVLAGRHPEAEMTGYLTACGFTNIAPLMGEVIRYDEQDTPHTIMIAQGFVRNQGDAWSWTLDYARRVSADISSSDDPGVVEDALSGYLTLAHAIGKRLAEMHAILAQDTDLPEFRPEHADVSVTDGWADGVVEQINAAVAALARVQDFPNQDAADHARLFINNADRLCVAARERARLAVGKALQTRVHGDFHLGQVLVTPGDATLIDFEGEPAKTMEQRRAKSSPMRDVAGMLRSFDYAAATTSASRVPGSEQAAERQTQLVEKFRRAAGLAFLHSYRKVLHEAPHPWVSRDVETALLDLFVLEKAAYEIRYEAANRPSWIGIPLTGVTRVLRHLVPEQEQHV
jgi:maltose alpha-D-glucosyltransferase/alpha-amylase